MAHKNSKQLRLNFEHQQEFKTNMSDTEKAKKLIVPNMCMSDVEGGMKYIGYQTMRIDESEDVELDEPVSVSAFHFD